MTMTAEIKIKLKINKPVNWRFKGSLTLVTPFVSLPRVKETETLPDLTPETVSDSIETSFLVLHFISSVFA